MKLLLALLIGALGCAIAAAPLHAGTGRYASEPSRLVIHRSANFGTYMSINVYIDGIFAGNIPHFPTVTSRRTEASDHGAVVADFVI